MSIVNIINKHHSEITQEEWSFLKKEGITNGCGGKGSFIRPPYGIFFEASCNTHDLSYYIGGNFIDKTKSDLGFLKAMIRDANKKKGIYVLYFISWSLLYFIGVSIFGHKYFNYGGIKDQK